MRSKEAIAWVTRSMVISSVPKAFLKSGAYPAMPRSRCTTASCEGIAISTGFTMGPFAWSSKSAARPSQNCSLAKRRLMTVGLLRVPCWCPTPSEVACGSVNPWNGMWQEAQEIVPSFESRGSK